jgi:hypothetical protein
MAVACSFPCECGCISIDIVSEYYSGEDAYAACECPISVPEGETQPCCPDDPTGITRLAKHGGHIRLLGSDADAGSVCMCSYAGTFELCKNGDVSQDSKSFAVLLEVYDDGLVYAEITGYGKTFKGSIRPSLDSSRCIVPCYNKDETLWGPVYTPVLGYITEVDEIKTVVTDEFRLAIWLEPEPTLTSCKTTCEVSHRVTAGGDVVLISRNQGRCPTISSPTWEELKADGMQCREEVGTDDCHGQARPDVHEYITHKDLGFAPGELPCTLDCGDLWTVDAASNTICAASLPDYGAWWVPQLVGLTYYNNPRIPCLEAARNGYNVWRLLLGPDYCVDWYVAAPPEMTMTHIRDATFFSLEAPCGVTCKFYEVQGCDESPTYGQPFIWLPGELLGPLLTALPGAPVVGCIVQDEPLIYDCLGLKATRYVRKVSDGYELCQLEQQDVVVAQCIDPIAPNIQISLYDCPNCPNCYNDDGSVKTGFVAIPNPPATGGRFYSEMIYGATRAGAVDAAIARAVEVNDSVDDSIVPYAHTLARAGGNSGYSGNSSAVSGGVEGNAAPYGKGCCAGAWGYSWPEGNVAPKWADLNHVQPCDWGLMYGSTVAAAGCCCEENGTCHENMTYDACHSTYADATWAGPTVSCNPNPCGGAVDRPDQAWQTELIFCCQCLMRSALCDYCNSNDNNGIAYDTAFTDFFKGVKTLSAPDANGYYCRDFGTPGPLAAGYKTGAGEAYAEECWAWLDHVTTGEPWKYIYDGPSSCSDPNPPGWPSTVWYTQKLACYAVATDHARHHLGRPPSGGTGYPATPMDSYPLGYVVPVDGMEMVCKKDADNNYYWLGLYRKCRWCDNMCVAHKHSCPNDNCMSGVFSSPIQWNPPVASPHPLPIITYCTDAVMNDAAAWVRNRMTCNIPNGNQPWVAECDLSLTVDNPDKVTGLAGCGRLHCVDVCGFTYSSAGRVAQMNTNISCYGYYFASVTECPQDVASYITAAAAAIGVCRSNSPSGSLDIYEVCPGDGCSTVADDMIDYYEFDAVYYTLLSSMYGTQLVSKSPWGSMKASLAGIASCSSFGAAFSYITAQVGGYVCNSAIVWRADRITCVKS